MKTLLIGTLLLCSPISASIQIMNKDFPTFLKRLVDSVERGEKRGVSIQATEPAWELTDKQVDVNSSYHSWKSGREGLSIRTFYATSVKEAGEKLQQELLHLSVGLAKTAELADIGDDVYSYGRTIYFRKSNVVVMLSASSPELAVRYAKRIAGLISDT